LRVGSPATALPAELHGHPGEVECLSHPADRKCVKVRQGLRSIVQLPAVAGRGVVTTAVPHPRRQIPAVELIATNEILEADMEFVSFGADGQPAAAQVRRRVVERSEGDHSRTQKTTTTVAWEVQRERRRVDSDDICGPRQGCFVEADAR
jgi:hypothetical protein